MTSSSPKEQNIISEEYGLDSGNEGTTLLGSETTTSSHDTIQFISSGDQPPVEYDYKGISKLMVDVAADDSHDIIDFLRRPVVIGSIDLGAKTIAGSDIFEANILDGIFTNDTIGKKIANYFAMRCTFCTKIVMNSQPYQAGVFYFHQRPYDVVHEDAAVNTAHWPAYHDYTGIDPKLLLTHKSGFPGVMLNITSVSEETIKVPYIGVTPSINLAAAYGNQVALTVVSPLVQGDTAPHAYATIYAWLEDVVLIGTDPYPAKAKWALAPQGGEHLKKLLKGEAPAQSAEAEKGTISKVADTVGGIAKTLSRIPVVSDIAGPVSWACDAVSGLGSIFGFSKPNYTKLSKPIVNEPLRNMALCDQASTATRMTVTKNAEVSCDSLGPTDRDEMNIVELAKRPCVYETITWQSSKVRGSKVGSWKVNPAYFYREAVRDIGAAHQRLLAWTYVGWLATLFQYWRGSMNFTFVFAATQFHSGRLRFVVTVNHSADLTSTNFDDPGHYSLVYDLRAGDTFTIKIPFLSYNYWRKCSENPDEMDVTLDMFVETQLVADGRASAGVGIVVMPSGCDDVAFCVPHNVPHGRAEYHKVTTPTRVQQYLDKYKLTPQGYDTLASTQQTDQVIEMYPQPPEHANVVAMTQAFGDPVTSLRTLSKRYTFKALFPAEAKTTVGIMPFLNPLNTGAHNSSFISTIREPYRFIRGGMRYLIVGLSKTIEPIQFKLVTRQQLNVDTSYYTFINGMFTLKYPQAPAEFQSLNTICDLVVREDLQGRIEVEVPYYAQYAMLDNMPYNTTAKGVKMSDIPETSATDVVLVWNQPTKVDVHVYEAAADDFSCGYIIGPPIWSYIEPK